MTLNEFVILHNNRFGIDEQRLGQRFFNMFMKVPNVQAVKLLPYGEHHYMDRPVSWPQLFYETNDHISLRLITRWLEQHQYLNGELPPLA